MSVRVEDVIMFLDDIGVTKENNDLDFGVADDAIYDKLGVSLDDFYESAKFLIDYTPIVESPLTDKLYKGFVNKENTMLLIKKKI
jgi:hypothetical protein